MKANHRAGLIAHVCVAATATVALLQASALAAPRLGYQVISSEQFTPAALGETSAILYLNRCASGCDLEPGFDDSTTNRSSILPYSAHIPPFPHGDALWQQVLTCVQDAFAPFDVEVVDVDPGAVDHFETLIGGSPSDIGIEQANVGGVAPFACQPIRNGVSYVFAASVGPDIEFLCAAAAQETGHVFGMDHVVLCEDAMSYGQGCGFKAFVDEASPCGEWMERSCACGGTQQNSFTFLVDLFGPASDPVTSEPTVRVTEPELGATVAPYFAIWLETSYRVQHLQLWYQGNPLAELSSRPFVFNSPPDLAPGPLEFEVRAWDDLGNQATTTHQVVVDDAGEPPDTLYPDTHDLLLRDLRADVDLAHSDDGGCHIGSTTRGSSGRYLTYLGLFLLCATATHHRRRQRQPRG